MDYIAIMHKEPNSAYGVSFPDFPGCVTAGDTLEQAREMVADLPPFVTVVALFVDEAPDRIRDILARVRVDLLQFHGDENLVLTEY